MANAPIQTNTLFYGDNLKILREHIADESVDLIYLDPPFSSNRNYNVLFRNENGTHSAAQITAFEDTWHWNDTTAVTYHEIVTTATPNAATMIDALRKFIGENQMMAYLVMMAARLIELHRALKPTGSLYLHCDPTASHYLRIVLDAVFGVQNFQNEIIWQRTNAHNMRTKGYVRSNDHILFFTKTQDFTFNEQYTPYGEAQMSRYKKDETGRLYTGRDLTFSTINQKRQFEWRGSKPPSNRSWGASLEQLEQWYQEGKILLKKDGTPRLDGLKVYLDETKGKPVTTNWTDIERVSNTTSERLGYPTQKPVALLERIIQASSNEDDVVLDPFCGCGTTIHAAQKLNRRWIGIDVTHLSIALQKYRLKDAFNIVEKRDYNVIGEPEDLHGARQLAQDDPYQFQWWALSLIQAQPLGGQAGSKQGKKGKDRGIDGIITFIDDATSKLKRLLVQVKSGKVKSGDIRDLRGTIERENAEMGVFITLEKSSKDMDTEAAAAGVYVSPGWNKPYPKIQILTIEQLLTGAAVQMPPAGMTFKKAQREQQTTQQEQLF